MANKPTKNPFTRIRELVRPDKKDLSNLYIYAIVAGILNLSLPIGIQSIVNFIQSGRITTSWIVLVSIVLGAVILAGFLQIAQFRIIENIQQRVFVRYSFDFAYRFPRFNKTAIPGQIPSELMNRFFDIMNLQKSLGKTILDFMTSFIQIAFGLIVLSFYHPFYIAFSICLIVILVIVFRPMMREGFETSLQESKYKYKTAHWLQEIARADWSFRLNPQGTLPFDRLDITAQDYLSSRENHFSLLRKQYLWMIAVKTIIVGSLLILGGILVINQQLSLGQFVAAEVLIILILSSVEKLASLLESLYDMSTALEKLGQIQDIPLSFEESQLTEALEENIFPLELFSIKTNEKIISIQRGKSIQIPIQSQLEGVALLRAMIDPSSSDKWIARWNMSSPAPSSLSEQYRHIGWYAKGSHLLEGTIEENLKMGRSTVSQADMQKAIETVGLSNYLDALPNGFSTILSKGSKILSEEERELFLIARALSENPKLMLISLNGLSLDIDFKNTLIKSIQENYQNTTLVIVNRALIEGIEKIQILL